MNKQKKEEEEVTVDFEGKVSKLDKWKYNDTLNDIARMCFMHMGLPSFKRHVKALYKALRAASTKKMNIREELDNEYERLWNIFQSKKNQIADAYWLGWLVQDIRVEEEEDKFWSNLFDYCLECATAAGFTIYTEVIDESVGLRG